MAKALYICYFGVQEPLVQTQVTPYLRELVKGGHEVSLLTFEPEGLDAAGIDAGRDACGPGIEWHWLRYHKRPSVPATIFDISNGARFVAGLIRKHDFDILHSRAHIPMIMAYLVRKLTRSRAKLLFDIRGFVPEEYVDAGIWSEDGSIYRAIKRVERRLMAEADGFVVLTEAARTVLFPESRETGFDKRGRPVAVIPCCVDFDRRFSGDRVAGRDRVRRELGIEGRFVYTHVGALGGLYLSDEIADLLAVAKKRDVDTFGLFLTQSDRKLILPQLRERGFGEGDYFVGRVAPDRIEDYMYASDVGLSFVKATFATKSRSPTKIPEYLAAGLPVIANAGVGDVEDVLEEGGAGVIVDRLDDDGYLAAVERLRQSDLGTAFQKRLQGYSRGRFDLSTVGGERYRDLYEKLTNS